MERERKQKLIVRWSIMTGSLIALFWAIWFLIAGEVPAVSNIKVTENWTYILPFGISRWWDVLVGPIFSAIIIYFLTNEKIEESEDLDLVITPVIVCVALVSTLAIPGVIADVALGLTLGLTLIAMVIAILSVALEVGIDIGLAISLGVTLVFGIIIFGIFFGLVFGLVFGLIIALWKLCHLVVHSRII